MSELLVVAQQTQRLERSEHIESRYCVRSADNTELCELWREELLQLMTQERAEDGQLRGNHCRVYAADLRVRVTPQGRYAYPDVVVICGTATFDDTKPQALINPTLIIEVLAESTAAYDRGDKFHDYRQVPTLTDYVLVTQDRAYVEHYQRQGESDLWLYQAVEGLEGTLLIGGLNLSLPLVDVYAQVDGIV